MRIFLGVLVGVLALTIEAGSQQQAKEPVTPNSNHTVGLIEMEVLNHIVSGPIGGGGYDDSFKLKRARYYTPDLADCSQAVADVTRQWAATHGGIVVKSLREPKRVLIHVKKSGTPGFYELLYRADMASGIARVTFLHYSGGVALTPDGDPNADVQALVAPLKEALTCREGSSSQSP